MGDFAPKGTDKTFEFEDFKRTVLALDFWLFALCYFFMTFVSLTLRKEGVWQQFGRLIRAETR
jgi:hypothetical protein